jgi:hypothetical protein
VLYSDGSGAITELALGANGTFLKSNGAAVAPSFATPGGSGDMLAATYDPANVAEQLVGLTAAQTMTNTRMTKRVTTAADATSITPNTDNADITYQANTQAAGTLTINADAGTPTNGQPWLLKIKSTNAQTFSWNADYVGGTNALPTATSGGSNIDYFAFIYDTVDSVWHYTGGALNF